MARLSQGHTYGVLSKQARTAAFAVRVSSLICQGSKRMVVTKYRSEPKGRRNFNTALHYNSL